MVGSAHHTHMRSNMPPHQDPPDYVWEWLNSIEKEDIERFNKWKNFIEWAETSRRYTAFLLKLMIIVFGMFVSIKTGLEAVTWFLRRH